MKSVVVTASTLFLVFATAVEICMAGLYVHGARWLDAAPSISRHQVRVLARPLRLTVHQAFSREQLRAHLLNVGYYEIHANEPGCFSAAGDSITIWSRYPELRSVTITWTGETIARIVAADATPLNETDVEPETIATMTGQPNGGITRERNDPLPVAALAATPLLDAVIASEDRWFRTHHGLDFARLALAPFAGGGGSTITMQLARLNVLEDRSRTLRRKANEIGIAMVLERLHSKDEILSAYMNSAFLGVSRGRPVQGFGAAAREFLGLTDVRELTPLQAATLAALLNQPSRYLDDLRGGTDTRLRKQRNRVLRLMHENFPDRYTAAALQRLQDVPITLSPPPAARGDLERVAHHFVDEAIASPALRTADRVYLTIDPALQRIAVSAVEQGLANISTRVPAAVGAQLQAAFVATDPRTGEVLAMVGGRLRDASQFNRATKAERQLGSIMKPFDYLAAFERAAAEHRPDITPETTVLDVPTTFLFRGTRPWTPANYGNRYAGTATWRQALAESRNVAAVKVAAWAGIDRVAALWEAASGRSLRSVFPSLALGTVEASPADVARAYAVFAVDGIARPLRTVAAVVPDGERIQRPATADYRVVSAQSATLVRDMMRTVIDAGTARSARAAGLTGDAAGKTGTTDDLRDAWFAGFADGILAVAWVGCDEGRPLGLTGAEAALPIWTDFMMHAAGASAAPPIRR